MTFFREIISKVDKIVDEIITTAPAAKKENTKPNSVNAVEIKEGNVDVINIQNNSTSVKQPTNNERTLGEVRSSLENVCKKNNIDGTKLMLSLSAITGKSLKEFNQLDTNVQKALLSFVEESVTRIEKRDVSDADKLESVVMEAAFMYGAITRNGDGTYATLESITAEQMAERRTNFEGSLRERYNSEMRRIESLPEEEKAEELQKLKNKHARIRHNTFNHVMKKVKPDAALELMAILAAKDLGEGAEEFLASIPEGKREEVASEMHNFNHFKKCLDAAVERGEDVESEEALASFEKYNTEFVAYKNGSAAFKYQQQYANARRNNEYSEKIFKAVATGIGYGAYINKVMLPEDKASFIAYWENDAKDFKDNDVIESVNQKVQEYIESHPEEAEEVKKTKKIVDTITGKNKTATYSAPRPLKVSFVALCKNMSTPHTTVDEPKANTNTTANVAEKVDSLVKSGKSLSAICAEDSTAVNYVLKNPKYSNKFLSDNNMIAQYSKQIKQYIKTNITNINDKMTFVENHPKTLPLMVSCLDRDEKKEFADAMKGKISYTVYKATFKES